MKHLSRLVLLAAFTPAAYAQLTPGDLLLNSINPDRLVHYRPDGTVVQTTGPGSGSSWVGVAILPNGNWATARRYSRGVNIFDGFTGAEIATWQMPSGFSESPADVGVFSDGTLAVVDWSGKVWRFDTAGNVIARWRVSSHPYGILVDGQDHVWTCDVTSGVVWHTDDQGNKIHSFSTGNRAGDVTMASDGTLFVTRFDTGEVAHFAQDGTFLGVFMATNGVSTAGIAMGLDQTLWVTSFYSPVIYNYDLAGNFLGSFDTGPAGHLAFLTIPFTAPGDIGTNYCGPANFNSTGQSAVISAFGSTVAFVNSVTLTASQLPPLQFGYFLASETQGFVAAPGGSQGTLCLGGQIARFQDQIQSAGSDGLFTIKVDLTAIPTSTPHTVIAGETWNFQAWFRDLNPGVTSNFTDAVSVLFK